MFGSRQWTRIALALNLGGMLLLFYSFQATSSSFRLIRHPISGTFQTEYEYEICVENYTLLSTDAHGGMFLGHYGCPASNDDRRAAVVNTEHPDFITVGFLLIMAGFMIQFFAVPEPRTVAQLRHEIKTLKKEEKLKTRK